jgi:hypothetical protein
MRNPARSFLSFRFDSLEARSTISRVRAKRCIRTRCNGHRSLFVTYCWPTLPVMAIAVAWYYAMQLRDGRSDKDLPYRRAMRDAAD